MWRGLHFILALALPLILTLVLLGCIKAKEEPADLGPQVSEEELDLALSKAVHGATLNPAVGQYITYSVTRRLETQEFVESLGAGKVEVIKKTEDVAAGEVTYTLRIVQSTKLVDGTYETVEKESALTLAIGASVAKALLAQTPSGRASVMAKPIKRTYHRLRQTPTQIDVPALVKSRPGCGGVPSCRLPVTHVQYDIVDWYSDTDFRKLAVDLTFSTVTPYLPFGKDVDQFTGLLITNCVSFQANVAGRTIFVRDCANLEDFQK